MTFMSSQQCVGVVKETEDEAEKTHEYIVAFDGVKIKSKHFIRVRALMKNDIFHNIVF